MRIVPAQYVYQSNPNIPHSLYKKPYAEYSTDYQAMELTWNQDPIVIDWRPDWDYEIPDVYIPDLTTEAGMGGALEKFIETEYTAVITRAGDADWDTAHDASEGTDIDIPSHPENLFWVMSGGVEPTIRRVFLTFDLSAYASVIITSATLSIKGKNHTGNTGTVHAQEGTQELSMTVSDYDAFTGTSFGSVEIPGNLDYGGSVSIDFSSSGVDYLNKAKGGWGKICIRTENDFYDDSTGEETGFSSATLGLSYA